MPGSRCKAIPGIVNIDTAENQKNVRINMTYKGSLTFKAPNKNCSRQHFQSGPQDQKSVIFSHSVISLNQLLQNSKNTANIFLTFRNHVKIFLSQYIRQNFLRAVYHKNLCIRTDRTDKTVKTLIRLLLEEQSDQGIHCLSFYLLHLHFILQRRPKLVNIRIFSILIAGVTILRGFHRKNVC